jgi:hypothetical protein
VVELDQRGVADKVQNGLGVLHGYKLTVLAAVLPRGWPCRGRVEGKTGQRT